MSDALNPRQVSKLLEEHGSYEAAIAARPDLADELDAAQRVGARLKKAFAHAYTPRPSSGFDPKKIAAAKFERDVRVYERALARHARAEARKRVERPATRPQLSDKQKAIYRHYPNATFSKVLALLEQGEDVSEIARETKLKRQDVDKFVLWRRGGVYDAIPGQIPNTVIFVKRPRSA
jgi:hypothetical protein